MVVLTSILQLEPDLRLFDSGRQRVRDGSGILLRSPGKERRAKDTADSPAPFFRINNVAGRKPYLWLRGKRGTPPVYTLI
jgi:hypothetical protein